MSVIPVGQEPERIKKRIDTLFAKLDGAYPDKVIRGLQKDHKKWAETVTELYRLLGYESGNAFLAAYGYTVENNKGGRPMNDHMAVIEELKRRYPNGPEHKTIGDLERANPDIAPKFKSLSNNANTLFGMTLAKYLVSVGVLGEKVSAPASGSAANECVSGSSPESPKDRKPQRKQAVELLPPPNPLAGKIVVATYLSHDEDKRVKKLIQECGGMLKNNVTKFTDILLTSDIMPYETKNLSRAKELMAKGSPICVMNVGEFILWAADAARQAGEKPKVTETEVIRRFTIENGTLTSYEGNEKNIVIPEGVKIIGPYVFAGRRIARAEIPEGVMEIRQGAFEQCSELLYIRLPESLKAIGSDVFANCRKLEEVTLPAGLTELGSGVFYKNFKLQSIRIPEGIKVIRKNTVCDCTHLQEVVLPEGLKKIQKGAFISPMAKLVLNGDDPVIERGAFQKAIRELVVGEKIRTIQGYTFLDCGPMESVRFLSRETKIGSSAFDIRAYPALARTIYPQQLNPALRRDMAPFAAVYIENGEASEEYKALWMKVIVDHNSTLEELILDYESLRNLMLRERLVSAGCVRTMLEHTTDAEQRELRLQLIDYLGKTDNTDDPLEWAEEDTLSLAEARKRFKVVVNKDRNYAEITGYKGFSSSVTVPAMIGENIVAGIGAEAFKNINWLQHVMLPDGLVSIGRRAFSYCRDLESIKIPWRVKEIGAEAFSFCQKLEEIALPEDLEIIPARMLYWCSGFTSIDLPETLRMIQSEAFYRCLNLQNITIPGSVKIIADGAFKECYSLQSAVLMEGVDSVGIDMFSCCHKLTSVSLPNSLRSIGKGAFYLCKALKKVVIPDGVNDIQPAAFCDSGVETVSLPGTLKVLSNSIFYNCHSLKSIRIPEGTVEIQTCAFASSALEHIYLPKSIESIGDSAFYPCTGLRIHAPAGSYAESYARKNNIFFTAEKQAE